MFESVDDNLPATQLVLERLPNGDYAWLRPERRYVLASRYYVTDRGRRALARGARFGPWPTVAEVERQKQRT
jgi:hypothetical protein